MDVSKEQKALKVFAIISLVFGIIGLFISVFFLLGGGIAANNTGAIASDAKASVEEVEQFAALFIGSGIAGILNSIVNIIDWYCLNKVSKDASKYKPAWIVTLTSFVLSCLSLAIAFTGKIRTQDIVNAVVAIALDAVVLYLINKVKQSVKA